MTYKSTVLADSPTLLWMLDESSGTTAADSTGNGHTGTYAGSYTQGVTGPAGVSTLAVGLDGSSAYVYEAASGSSPDTFTCEYWFKTSNASNGISGFAGSQTAGAGGNQDRSVDMSSGQLTWFVYTGGTDTVTTSGTYNDGAWHYLAAVMSGSIMGLYLDGSLAVSQGGYAPGADYTGYWLAGANGGFPTYLNGSLSAFAVYPVALTSTQVSAHYAAASGGGASASPQPLVVPSLAAIQAASW